GYPRALRTGANSAQSLVRHSGGADRSTDNSHMASDRRRGAPRRKPGSARRGSRKNSSRSGLGWLVAAAAFLVVLPLLAVALATATRLIRLVMAVGASALGAAVIVD